MKRKLLLFLLATILIPSSGLKASPVDVTRSLSGNNTMIRGDIDVSLHLVGGKGSILRQGRNIELTFKTSTDAYVVIYNIDTEGLVQLLYPENGELKKTRGNKMYFLPEKGKGISWKVRGKTGIEYIHAIAVTDGDRIDRNELRFLAQNHDLPEKKQFRIDMDPFLAFNMIDEGIIRDAADLAPASDFTYFYIGREVDYPRYLCSKCHGVGKISDPYGMECPEIVIEKMIYEEDPVYPYPALFSIQHVDDDDDSYNAPEYYADNITGGYDDYDDYDNDKVYLSIYYTNYDYPYSFYYPSFWTWNTTYYDPWGWNSWDPYYSGFSFTFHWDNYYYHHWPFYSWYGYRYDYYTWAYNYGFYNGYYPPYDYNYYRSHRSIYAKRTFKKRALDYASVSRTNNRRQTLADSRVKKARPDSRTIKHPVRDKNNIRRNTYRPATVRTPASVKDRSYIGKRVIHGDSRKTRTIRPPGTPRNVRDPSRPTSDKGTRRTLRDRSTDRKEKRTVIDRKSNTRKEKTPDRSRSSARKERSGTSSRSGSSAPSRPRKTSGSSAGKSSSPDRSRAGNSSSRSSRSSSSRSSSSRNSSSRGSSSKGSSSRSRRR